MVIMKDVVEEVVALNDVVDEHAQQLFHALDFTSQHGSSVMKHLASAFSTLVELGYPHLKRMKKHPTENGHLLALIAPVSDSGEIPADLQVKMKHLVDMFNGTLTQVNVLKHAPKTRETWEKYTKAWPLIFHVSVQQGPQVAPIEENEALDMYRHLCAAVDIAKKFDQLHPIKSHAFCSLGCVIVDPAAVLAVGAGKRIADSLESFDRAEYSFRPLYHPIMVAIDAVAARDRRRNAIESPTAKKAKPNTDAPISNGSNESVQDATAPAVAEESYLCTGYDVYLDREPCVTCAMALVHSRARRVVFNDLNPTDGALASHFHLHTIKSLNHHYRAFRLPLNHARKASTS